MFPDVDSPGAMSCRLGMMPPSARTDALIWDIYTVKPSVKYLNYQLLETSIQ